MKQHVYTILGMDKCNDLLGEAAVIFSLDTKNGYWQVVNKNEDRDKTDLKLHHQLYDFLSMPFRSQTAPNTFHRGMDVAISAAKRKFNLVYLNDNVGFSRSTVEHIDPVKQVFMFSGDARGTLKLEKCKFFAGTFNYLGHVIRSRSLEIASLTPDVMKNLKARRNLTKLKFFLAFSVAFGKFFFRFAKLASPLIDKSLNDPSFSL